MVWPGFEYHALVRMRFKFAVGLCDPWNWDGASLSQLCPLSILLSVCGIGSCSIWPRAMPRLSEACTTASTSGSEVMEANIHSRLFAVPPLGLAQFRAGVRRARLSQTSHFATLLNLESRKVH